MTYEQIIFDVQDRVARITLNRPNAANSINLELARELMDAAIRCDADPGIRAVLLTGAGDKMFSAGGDLKSFATYGAEIAFALKEITTYLHSAISHFARMDAPLIVAVNGVAAGRRVGEIHHGVHGGGAVSRRQCHVFCASSDRLAPRPGADVDEPLAQCARGNGVGAG
jgi:1,4-dihydroxy-2-naphthoyl-CoA synthase